MIKYLFTGLFLISFLFLILLIRHFKNHISGYYILLFSAVLLSDFGYMQMAHSTELGMALYANETIYLGASFSPFFLTMCMADLCKTKMKTWFQIVFLCCGAFLLGCSGTIGVFPWYYKSVELVQGSQVNILVKEYGPLHVVYPIYLGLNVLICFYLIINSYFKKKDVSYVVSILLLFCMLSTVGTYIVEKLSPVPIILLPFSYALAEAVVLMLLRRISLYDVSAVSTDYLVESKSNGFILVDSKGKLLGYDIAAKIWFPEIDELRIDQVIKTKNTEILWHINDWIKNDSKDTSVHIHVGENVIHVHHAIIKESKSKKIHCFYLRDDTKHQQYTELIEKYNETLTRDVDEKTKKLSDIQEDIIISMASIVENRDSNTGGHITRTSDVVRIFVKHLQRQQMYRELTPEVAKAIVKAAPLHDFGKIAIPDVILNKPGKFEPDEYEEMKKHSEKGAVIVERILQNAQDPVFKEIAVNVAHYHHEKWDGTGYPERIRRDQIPFEARIMALADVFDALVSKRVYKESYSYDKAFSIIAESKGTHFDPVLCKEFLKCRAQLERLYDSYGDD